MDHSSGPGRASFGTSEEFAVSTKAMAANQGLYNGFLAAGLLWGALASDPVGFPARVFFASCVAAAGLFGAVASSRKILFVQTVPALAYSPWCFWPVESAGERTHVALGRPMEDGRGRGRSGWFRGQEPARRLL